MSESTFNNALGKLADAKHYSEAEEIYIGYLQPLAEEGESLERLELFKKRSLGHINMIFAANTDEIFNAARDESMRRRSEAAKADKQIDYTSTRGLAESLVERGLAAWVDEARCIIVMDDCDGSAPLKYRMDPPSSLKVKAHVLREFMEVEDRRMRGELPDCVAGHELMEDGLGIRMIVKEEGAS